jgi:hypothetical protein
MFSSQGDHVDEKRSYVGGDIRGVQDFIFASTRLFEARGASTLIDFFDRCAVPHLVEAAGGKTVFSGGGNFLASFPPDAKLEPFLEAARLAHIDLTGEPYGVALARTEAPAGFQKGREEVEAGLRAQKRAPDLTVPASGLPFWKRCESCARAPAGQRSQVGETDDWVCGACVRKRWAFQTLRESQGESRQTRLGFACLFHDRSCDLPLLPYANDLAGFNYERDVGHVADREREVGFVLADGNGLGEWFASCGSEDEYQKLSQRVDTKLRSALVEASKAAFPKGRDARRLPMQVLICGGDDLLAVVPAARALPFARCFLETFVVERPGEHPKGAASGVLICNERFPFRQAHDLAEALLREAKRKCRAPVQPADPASALDFHRVTTSMVQSLAQERAAIRREGRDASGIEIEWSYGAAGPYTPRDMEELAELARALERVTRSQRGLLREILSPLDDGPGTATERGVPALVLERIRAWNERQRDGRPLGDLEAGWARHLVSTTVKRGSRPIQRTSFRLADALAIADMRG